MLFLPVLLLRGFEMRLKGLITFQRATAIIYLLSAICTGIALADLHTAWVEGHTCAQAKGGAVSAMTAYAVKTVCK